jgi:hypothetical protein
VTEPPSKTPVGLYRDLIRERVEAESCHACGRALDVADLAPTADGAAFEEYGLSPRGTARALAATEQLTVHCGQCGAVNHLGTSRTYPAAPPRVPEPPLPWPPSAIAAYRTALRERLAEQPCGRCGFPLASADVLSASGGSAGDDLDLSDEGMARMLAATQSLKVSCRRCRRETCLD